MIQQLMTGCVTIPFACGMSAFLEGGCGYPSELLLSYRAFSPTLIEAGRLEWLPFRGRTHDARRLGRDSCDHRGSMLREFTADSGRVLGEGESLLWSLPVEHNFGLLEVAACV